MASSAAIAAATTDDRRFTILALGLATRGLGIVWPNPAVGCVLVREGDVVGRGWTQPGGRPHAETEALERAGEAAKGATAYVSLEPCAHHGQTAPCAEALIKAGVARVVVPLEDPDPRVAGKGLSLLRAAGIEVACGVETEAAVQLNAGFIKRVSEGRPLVTLKFATTLDGRIATHAGESRWITGEASRRRAHLLRAQADAVMIGVNTALIDNPELTCRLPGLEARTPVRVVLDRRLRTALTSNLVAGAHEHPCWIITADHPPAERAAAFRDAGVELIEVGPDADGRPDLTRGLVALGERGLTRVLVEGGSHLAASLFRAGRVDRLTWFRAPLMMGGDGIPGAAAFGVDRLADAPSFHRLSVEPVGDDVLETYAVTA